MADPFANAKALLTRSSKHANEFAREVLAFGHRNGGTPFTEFNPHNGYTLFKIVVTEDVPLIIPCILFDIVNELRTALDYAVFAAATVITKLPEPAGTKFPFGVDASDARKNFDRNKPPAGLHKLRDFIVDTIQPYKGGRNEVLWSLNKLRNSNMHRQLAPTVAGSGGMILGGQLGLINTIYRWDSEKKEVTFLEASDVQGDLKVQVFPRVAFVEQSAFPRANVLEVLGRFGPTIKHVLAGIESETWKLAPS